MADIFINCSAVGLFKNVDMYLQYELITLFKQSLPNPSIAVDWSADKFIRYRKLMIQKLITLFKQSLPNPSIAVDWSADKFIRYRKLMIQKLMT